MLLKIGGAYSFAASNSGNSATFDALPQRLVTQVPPAKQWSPGREEMRPRLPGASAGRRR
jgi:hypothetical protein